MKIYGTDLLTPFSLTPIDFQIRNKDDTEELGSELVRTISENISTQSFEESYSRTMSGNARDCYEQVIDGQTPENCSIVP